MKTNYVGAIISDIHFGALDAKRLYTELEQFLEYLEDLIVLDYVIIDGDFYHNKVSANSPHAFYSFLFFKRLIEIVCIKKGGKIRIVQGTKSHDLDQLKLLEALNVDSTYDMKVIYSVESEYLFDDLKVLYIPEEYIEDKDEYYGEYFKDDDIYDLIFFHGLVTDAAFYAKTQESGITHKKAPIFDTNLFLTHCKGCIMSGHIHTPMVIKERFYYVGSYSCWIHGEEEDKGFYLLNYSPVNYKYEAEFIVNKLRQKYLTMRIGKDNPIYKMDMEKVIKTLGNFDSDLEYDNLRIILNLPDEYENQKLLTDTINLAFKTHRNVKIMFKSLSKEQQEDKANEKINLLKEVYSYLFDKSLSYEEKISKYIKTRYGKDIDTEIVRDLLYSDLKGK